MMTPLDRIVVMARCWDAWWREANDHYVLAEAACARQEWATALAEILATQLLVGGVLFFVQSDPGLPNADHYASAVGELGEKLNLLVQRVGMVLPTLPSPPNGESHTARILRFERGEK